MWGRFDIKMVKEVDFDKILEYSKNLITYEGKLPLLVRAVIMKQYSKNLMKKGIYSEVMSECANTKPRTYTEAVKELTDWVKENKEYTDMLK